MKNVLYYLEKDKTLLGKVVIFKNDKIYRVFDNFTKAFEVAKNRDDLIVYQYPKNLDKTRILPLKIKSFRKHPWVPLYPIKFFIDNDFLLENALIDSGADISAISYEFGLKIGLSTEKHDYIFEVEGLGGSMEYILKSIKIEIDNTTLQIPVAWLQDKNSTDIIIGREVVFDMFNIEFKQKSEEIIFKNNKIAIN